MTFFALGKDFFIFFMKDLGRGPTQRQHRKISAHRQKNYPVRYWIFQYGKKWTEFIIDAFDFFPLPAIQPSTLLAHNNLTTPQETSKRYHEGT